MRLSVAAIGGLVVAALAAPSTHHVVHEKRSAAPNGWKRHAPLADKRMILPMRIGLKQQNMDVAHDKLMAISDPSSPEYGDHLSAAQIVDLFAPSQETVDAIRAWLSSAGISADRVSQSWNKGWLEFDATVTEAEELLKTEYHQYKHASEHTHVACEEYSVPAHIQDHVDIITPTMHFDPHVRLPTDPQMKTKRDFAYKGKSKEHPWTGPKLGSKKLTKGAHPNVIGDTDCGTYITPGCLRELYNIPANGIGLNLSSFGIVEYAPNTFLQSDLNDFESNEAVANYGLTTNTGGEPVGFGPTIDGIDGGYFTTQESFDYNGESDLDLQYAIDLVYPQKVTLFQTGDNTEGASFDNFLDAIDASYCTFEGGDNPAYDPKFPDPYGGYQGPEACGKYKAPAVLSTSYAYNEADLSPAYEARQCAEYMKLGLAGTSIMYSSGDYGVAGNGGECLANNRFNPSFPGTCPYITSVGATQIPSGGSVTQPETACETVIYSGGGFSNNFALPSYQHKAVKKYFKDHKPKYTSAQYNNTEMSRGLPDVSANGANYVVYVDGEAEIVFGTSASSPTFASIITLINNVRAQNKLPSLGFLNPVFYKYPGMFNDITSGGNQGCGTAGFSAVKGWDPVTGLGTPNYSNMVSRLGNLKKVPTTYY